MGPDRLTQRKKQSQTDGDACETGRQSWKGQRDWHMMTHSWTLTLWSWGQMAHRGLHYPCMMRPPTPASHPKACDPAYAEVADGPYATTGGGNCWQRCCKGARRQGQAGQPLSQRPAGGPCMWWKIRC